MADSPRLFHRIADIMGSPTERTTRDEASPTRRFFDFTTINVALDQLPPFHGTVPLADCPPPEAHASTPDALSVTSEEATIPAFPQELYVNGPFADLPSLVTPSSDDEEMSPTDRKMLLIHASKLIDHIDLDRESEGRRLCMQRDNRTLAKMIATTTAEKLHFRDIDRVTTGRVSTERELVCRLIDACDDRCLQDDLKPPNEFLCPISLRSFREPMVAADSLVYEASYIERHLFTRGPMSPITRKPLVSGHLYTNHPLRTLMEAWATKAADTIFPNFRLNIKPAEKLEIATFLVENGYVK
jgi:hypothetical protein